MSDQRLRELSSLLKTWAIELGFSELRITTVDLEEEKDFFEKWLQKGFHGEMDFMARHGKKRLYPDELIPGTLRIITVRMNYLDDESFDVLNNTTQKQGYVSLYAMRRDYHRVIRNRLEKLAQKMQDKIGPFAYRAFSDSAPVLEVAFAKRSGLGWQGKNNLLISRDGGSFFFLGELFVDLPLPTDDALDNHCGRCERCIKACPTQAILNAHEIDARRCISYLTIEYKGSIPIELRALMGNKIYGCDDCQTCCPFNRFAQKSFVNDFKLREQFKNIDLLDYWAWTKEVFQQKTAGTPIYRTGYERWMRNIAVALGNRLAQTEQQEEKHMIVSALKSKYQTISSLVDEHITWALNQKKDD